MSLKNLKGPLDFVKKRFYRLYPMFWICMIFTSIFLYFLPLPDTKFSISNFLANLTMVPNLFGENAIDGVYWTLKVELFFYLIVLIVLILKIEKKIINIAWLYFLIGIVIITLKGYLPLYYFYGSLLLNGVLFFRIYENNKKSNIENILIIMFCLLCYFLKDKMYFFFNILQIVIFYLLIYRKLKFLSNPILSYFGHLTFALYLVHQNIGFAINIQLIKCNITNPIVLLIVPFTFSLIISIIFTDYFDKYFTAFLKKIFND